MDPTITPPCGVSSPELAAVLARRLRTLPSHIVLRACSDALLDLKTLRRIKAQKEVRRSSLERLAHALRALGVLDPSPHEQGHESRPGCAAPRAANR